MRPNVVDLAIPQQSDRDLMSLADLGRAARLLWRRKLLILIGAALGVGAGYAYYRQAPPVYRSKAQVLVVQRRPASGEETQTLPEDDAAIHVKILKSPSFIKDIIDTYALDKLPSLARGTNRTGRVVTGLNVTRDADIRPGSANAVLDLSYQGSQRDDCAVILNAVIKGYEEFLRTRTDELNKSSLAQLNGNIKTINAQIKTAEEALDQFRKENPLLSGSFASHAKVAATRFSEMDARSTELAIQRAELETRLRRFEELMAESTSQSEKLELIPVTFLNISQRSNPGGSRSEVLEAEMHSKLYPLLMERQQLLDEWGSQHPKVLDIEDKIRFTEEFYAKNISEAADAEGASADSESPELDPAANYVRYLQAELETVKAQQDALQPLIDKDRETAHIMAKLEEKEDSLKSTLTRQKELYNSHVNAVQQLTVLPDPTGITTEILAEPTPATKIAPRRVLIMAVGVTCGMLFGLCLAVLVDNSDKSFRSPEEIRKRLMRPVLGHIPCIPIRNGAADATPGPFDAIVRSYYNPLSTVAEAFRGVRAAIFAAGREKTCQVVQIASPNVGDGKTVLTVNLAVSIAQSGKRVLLVDADLRRPSVSKVLGTPLDNGFAMVLAGEIEVLDAIVPSGIPNLDVLPGCGTSRSPADLITSPNLKETIDLARERYDYVLLDTPALLAVTDGAAVAPFVDATILVVRITKNVRTFVEHALEILNTVQAQVLGIVVNTLQADNYSGLGRGYPFARFYKRDHVYFTEKSLHKAADREENGHGAPRAAKAAESTLAQQ